MRIISSFGTTTIAFSGKDRTSLAFQGIHQFISGVMGMANPEVPVPDDVTMRDIKGFDKFVLYLRGSCPS